LTPGSAGRLPANAKVRRENRSPGAGTTAPAGTGAPATEGTGVSETERTGVSEPARSSLRPPSVEAGLMDPATTNPSSARDAPTISPNPVIDVRPRRPIESVQPSAIVGHVR